MTNTNATPALEYCLALAPRSDRWEAEAELRALMAERDRLRAALGEIAGDLRGRCEPGTTAMHCYNVATRALGAREGVKP